MQTEFCIPAHNEEAVIGDTIHTLRPILAPYGGRVIVCDNASNDETAARATEAGAAVVITRIKGKGAAVIACARASRADIFGFIDADLSADPHDIPHFLDSVLQDRCDIAIGSRLLDTTLVTRSWVRTAPSIVFNLLRRAMLGIRAKDTQCGLKVMNTKGRAVLASCSEQGWFFDLEFLARAEAAGLRIHEIPVHWDEQRYPGRSSKLRLVRDGIGAVAAIVRIKSKLRPSL